MIDRPRRVGDRQGLAFALSQLGAAAEHIGDFASARTSRTEAAVLARDIGDGHTLGLSLVGLAYIARMQDSLEGSLSLFKEALIHSHDLTDLQVLLRSLAGLAGVAGITAEHARAIRLFGAVEAGREAHGSPELPTWRAISERDIASARDAMTEAEFGETWAAGQAMSLEQAVAYALDEASTPA